MSGSATSAQIAGLRGRAARQGRDGRRGDGPGAHHAGAGHPAVAWRGPIVDVVGTGGDRAHTVNVSTMAAIVAAAAGARVVKHGNRAASSSCGAADVLEHLGIVLDLSPSRRPRGSPSRWASPSASRRSTTRRCVSPVRRARRLGVPTVFNFLGPLTNPARPTAQAIGVFDPGMLPVVAGVFAERGVSALVFRGDDGLDELTTADDLHGLGGPRRGPPRRPSSTPPSWASPASAADALRGGDVAFNAQAVHDLLARQDRPGPRRGAAQRGGRAGRAGRPGRRPRRRDGRRIRTRRRRPSTPGRAADILDRWIGFSRSLRPS